MDEIKLKRNIPTFMAFWERRRKASRNRLPKHLRPPSVWPIWIQLLLNIGIIVALCTLMLNKDDYLTDAGPAITMILCLLMLIYTIYEGLHMRDRYQKTKGHRLATLNFWIMAVAFLCWPAAVAVFLP